MLGQIEVLLAFTAVMAAISLIITVLNQAASTALNLRGWSLRWGVSTAFKNVFPQLKEHPAGSTETFADHIAHAVLVHPLISDSVLPKGKLVDFWRVASAIRFEELKQTLSVIADPERGLSPEISTWSHEDAIAWLSRRIDFMKDWFSVMMDRVTQHFTFYMRIVTVAFAALIVSYAHIDSISLYNGLSSDVKLRNGVLANIPALQAAKKALDDAATEGDAAARQNSADSGKRLAEISAQALTLSDSLKSPLAVASQNPTWIGELITMALLALGAPFWFNQLRALSNLRSAVAAKEEKEKIAAQNNPPIPVGPARMAIGVDEKRNEGELI